MNGSLLRLQYLDADGPKALWGFTATAPPPSPSAEGPEGPQPVRVFVSSSTLPPSLDTISIHMQTRADSALLLMRCSCGCLWGCRRASVSEVYNVAMSQSNAAPSPLMFVLLAAVLLILSHIATATTNSEGEKESKCFRSVVLALEHRTARCFDRTRLSSIIVALIPPLTPSLGMPATSVCTTPVTMPARMRAKTHSSAVGKEDEGPVAVMEMDPREIRAPNTAGRAAVWSNDSGC